MNILEEQTSEYSAYMYLVENKYWPDLPLRLWWNENDSEQISLCHSKAILCCREEHPAKLYLKACGRTRPPGSAVVPRLENK